MPCVKPVSAGDLSSKGKSVLTFHLFTCNLCRNAENLECISVKRFQEAIQLVKTWGLLVILTWRSYVRAL